MAFLSRLSKWLSTPALEQSIYRCRDCGSTQTAAETVCPDCGGSMEEFDRTAFPEYLGPME